MDVRQRKILKDTPRSEASVGNNKFQCSLFLEIRTLVTWLRSNLLLKIKCFDTHIYMKTEYLQTNKTQHCLERKMFEKRVE